MSDLSTRFEAAVAHSKNLTERPDNATLLKLYALYKQASAGDNRRFVLQALLLHTIV